MSKEKIITAVKKFGVAAAAGAVMFAGGAFGTFVASEYTVVKNVREPETKTVASATKGAHAQDIYSGNPSSR